MNPTQILKLTGMAYGGDAFGRLPDGRMAFVPFALSGEEVEIELVEEKRGFVRGKLLSVLRPAPERIAPKCPHFADCGGCHYQYLDYAHQLAVKQDVVRDQLERTAGIKPAPVQAVIPSPQEWYYRNAVQYHLSEQGKLGFLRAGSHEVIEVTECSLPLDEITTVWKQIDLEPLPGVERVELRQGADDAVMMIFEGNDPQALPEMEIELPVSVAHKSPVGTLILAGDNALVQEVLGRPFRVSPGAFFQVNTAQAENMVREVVALCGDLAEKTVLDVYCGVGLFSAFLAEKAAHLIGVEYSEAACDDFAVNLNEFENVELYVGAAEEILPHLTIKPDVIVLDPPRAGVDRYALDAILAMNAERIVYVSCDPSTLARDLKRMINGGYTLNRVQPLDMFPQTYHVETIVWMSRKDQ